MHRIFNDFSSIAPRAGSHFTYCICITCIMPNWFKRQCCARLMDIDTKQLSSQRFWEIMDLISYEAIVSFERDITVQMVRDFGIDLRQILFEGTNFLTFIDTFNDRFALAQRGKNKEDRKALRIVKLALMLSSLLQRELCHK